ncbi:MULTISPECIES: aminoglycoside phosphotransferase family protein [unclassified Streptomyces]|uniref:aminoglycoside phosphotransferase family protein n=1 Tax=unclassified Streptomyces TaxID=2593676 RepID=UPI00037C399A|nr:MULTISPECIES: aminoglycoside phosphotransferase family protein [unclassified Streptomyces]MYT28982.1 kinase [Streptomyces sp. SID8354]
MATAPIEPPQRLLTALGGAAEGPVRAWLEALPELAQQRLADWELTLERVHAPGGRSSLVAFVRQSDGSPAVLKFPVPGRAAAQEAAALRTWDGWGAVRLLRADEAGGALLLERLQGSVSLRSLPEARALLEAAGTVRRLWVAPPAGHPFATVAERTAADAERLLAAGEPAGAGPLLDEALELGRTLPAGAAEEYLLHGAFRQGKVLAGERAPWLTVGPSPLVGERAYDLARLVLDRFEDLLAGSGAAPAARRRVAKLADSLDVDRERLRGWTLYRAVRAGVREAASGDRRRGEALLEFAAYV